LLGLVFFDQLVFGHKDAVLFLCPPKQQQVFGPSLSIPVIGFINLKSMVSTARLPVK
jgi:hypothetical protein